MNPSSNLASTSLTSDLLASNSPIRELLARSVQIGAVYRLADFDEALVITHDKFVHDANGVPLHAFLLGAAAELADPRAAGRTSPDDEEVVLLRVVGTTPLPHESNLERLRAEAGIGLVTEDTREVPRLRSDLVDPLTENEMSTAGLRCAVLGTFWDVDGRRRSAASATALTSTPSTSPRACASTSHSATACRRSSRSWLSTRPRNRASRSAWAMFGTPPPPAASETPRAPPSR